MSAIKWLCIDCTLAAHGQPLADVVSCYGPDALADRAAAITSGLATLGDVVPGNAVLGFDPRPCDCCRSTLAGERHAFLAMPSNACHHTLATGDSND